ncbi:MAG: hypothetical protein PHY93_21715 [Bacteriovorax sp.]|nr:hypothetical protein [Bacteriovorax sp.]
MNKNQFAKIANSRQGNQCPAERQGLLREAIDFIVKELNIEFGDFKVYVRQGKSSERIEINKSLHIDLKSH